MFFTSICHSTTLECLAVKKKENWEIIALWSVMEDDKSSVLTFVLGYSASMTTSIHFSRSFERAANVSSSWEVLTFQIYSIQSRCGVIWDPFSSDLGSICDTICLQKSHPNTQCGWQSTEKIQSFSCLSKISRKSTVFENHSKSRIQHLRAKRARFTF